MNKVIGIFRTLLILLSVTNLFAQNDLDKQYEIDKFKPFSKYSTRTELYQGLSPQDSIRYFEVIFYSPGIIPEKQLLVYKGDSSMFRNITKGLEPTSGFYIECDPGICFTYIVAIDKNDSLVVIDDKNELRKFMGTIDNQEELLLRVKSEGLWYDQDTIIGGSYLEREEDYLLYLMEYSSWPVTYRSVRALMTKSGEFEVIDKSIYYQTNEYYTH
ncbi:MAG: hypothetical protein RJQ09_14495 [Cyclobacteriaceae bacterium]